MKDPDPLDDSLWDRFLVFALPDPAAMPRAAVQAELRERGIDLSRAMSQMRRALATSRAREELAAARAKRPGVVAALRDVATSSAGAARDHLLAAIERVAGSQQAVYYRKLEQAATDEDLRALEEDLRRLEKLGDG
jgi:hypothetical protein